ncbi:carbamoyl-phosphate synthase L chain, ATP binding domain-containing protein [Cladochytrium replicatum]|nr:carbamoyl-phosphate synthase L chain, ATP binding domain-containing protein [Cladochytrium replicatum]
MIRFLSRSTGASQSLPATITQISQPYLSRCLATSATDRKPLFDKILVANRGEIACRIMRTAKKLGIKTVAVFSDQDRNALHTTMADEAYLIGPAPSAESYLQQQRIIDVAKATGAAAIHPGYGFLSENSGFAEKVTNSYLTFIGPPSQAIIDMGSKSESKIIMTRAQVPVVPGYHGENQKVEFLKQEADKIGYPVLIKAVMGGGGKGMRIVEKPEDFELMLESSRREAIKSFGNDTVLIEKYITRPRHIEVQVFADKLGNAVYLFERDCSVQRRHQKILEEAPAPLLSEELRKSLGEKAVAAAKAVNYVGAGTVEFIFDTDENKFYFMEMNTRLQVEHPITEMITGTDLVQWQFEVAAGNPLPKMQHELAINGHAFEARVYAENPANNFLPDTGPLLHMSTPAPSDIVRIETGVRAGDEVSVYYDPMISKLVVHGSDRTEALRRLRVALGEFEVVGPKTNIEFLKRLASHPAFIAAEVETGFIKKHESELMGQAESPKPVLFALAILHLAKKDLAAARQSSPVHDPWGVLGGVRLNSVPGTRTFTFEGGVGKGTVSFGSVSGEKAAASISVTDSAGNVTEFDNVTFDLTLGAELRAHIGGRLIKSSIAQVAGAIHVFCDGEHVVLNVAQPAYVLAQEKKDTAGSIRTPMPCKISQVMVKAGDKVKKGQPLVILEAMKMEHVVKSPHDGTVQKVHFKVGDMVGEKKLLLDLAEE